MDSYRNVRLFTFITLGVLGVLFMLTEGFGVFGIITFFCAVLYLVWDKGGDNNNDNDDYYKFNLQ